MMNMRENGAGRYGITQTREYTVVYVPDMIEERLFFERIQRCWTWTYDESVQNKIIPLTSHGWYYLEDVSWHNL